MTKWENFPSGYADKPIESQHGGQEIFRGLYIKFHLAGEAIPSCSLHLQRGPQLLDPVKTPLPQLHTPTSKSGMKESFFLGGSSVFICKCRDMEWRDIRRIVENRNISLVGIAPVGIALVGIAPVGIAVGTVIVETPHLRFHSTEQRFKFRPITSTVTPKLMTRLGYNWFKQISQSQVYSSISGNNKEQTSWHLLIN
jgi:hypothetical protein